MEYIEREAVLKFELTANLRPEKITAVQAVADAIAAYIKSIPAADVVPVRHGRWLKYAPRNSDLMTCSECEKYWILDGDQYDYHYCPNCGALMDKDGDGK